MSNIFVPSAFAQDPVVVGPLLTPTNAAQDLTFAKAVEARTRFERYASVCSIHFVGHVGHNLHVSERTFMPFAEGVRASDTVKPYAAWQGYDHLVYICKGEVRCHNFGEEKDLRYREEFLRQNLAIWRRLISDNMHHLDRQVIQIAIGECVDQIENVRSRQSKRREPR